MGIIGIVWMLVSIIGIVFNVVDNKEVSKGALKKSEKASLLKSRNFIILLVLFTLSFAMFVRDITSPLITRSYTIITSDIGMYFPSVDLPDGKIVRIIKKERTATILGASLRNKTEYSVDSFVEIEKK